MILGLLTALGAGLILSGIVGAILGTGSATQSVPPREEPPAS
jgi:hypothetical protein